MVDNHKEVTKPADPVIEIKEALTDATGALSEAGEEEQVLLEELEDSVSGTQPGSSPNTGDDQTTKASDDNTSQDDSDSDDTNLPAPLPLTEENKDNN